MVAVGHEDGNEGSGRDAAVRSFEVARRDGLLLVDEVAAGSPDGGGILVRVRRSAGESR